MIPAIVVCLLSLSLNTLALFQKSAVDKMLFISFAMGGYALSIILLKGLS